MGTEAAMETMSRSLLCSNVPPVSVWHQAKIDRENAQREASLIAAVIDAQGCEDGQLFKARYHRLCQRGREVERQMLHLLAVWEDIDDGVGDPNGL